MISSSVKGARSILPNRRAERQFPASGAAWGAVDFDGAAAEPAMMNLREIVERYKALAKTSGEPVALEAFGLSPAETAKLFTAMDEDYHISRFLTFSQAQGTQYSVSGNAVTHLRLDEGILSLL